MFFIIETTYIGPNKNRDGYVDVDQIEISTCPAITNRSHEPRIDGFCGCTNDYSVYAHGEYATIEAARAAIAEKFGDVREFDENGSRFESSDPDVIETYKPGKYTPLGRDETAAWIFEAVERDVQSDTTDERIAELRAEYEAEANSEGYTLDSSLEDIMLDRRQELRDERENE